MNGPFDAPFIQHVSRLSSTQPAVSRPARRPRVPDGTIDPKLAHKRAKAAERQRNKRQRDRQRDRDMQVASGVPPQQQHHHHQQQHQQQPGPEPAQFSGAHTQPAAAAAPPPPPPPPPTVPPPASTSQMPSIHDELTYTHKGRHDEDDMRREKVRVAARERQRKHRALVKARKMQELAATMGEDGMPVMEEVHYALGPDGQYQPVLPAVMHPPPDLNGADHQFPKGQPPPHTGGQTFASTLLIALQMSMLKQNLLQQLHMTNEELQSLEPILSAAWDQWDAARRAHYAEQAAKANAGQNGAGMNGGPQNAPPPSYVPQPPPGLQDPNDFRTRFHRPLTAPSPFGVAAASAAPPPGTQIDPTLSNGATLNGVLAQVVQAATAAAAAAASKQDADKNGNRVGSAGDGDGKSDGEGSVVDGKATS